MIVTGSETDVCVLATVLGAVDLGYRVIVVRDAVCSSSDEGHDALMTLYHQRSLTLRLSCSGGIRKLKSGYLILTSLSIACLSGRSPSQ